MSRAPTRLARPRLRLEVLEDRSVPASFINEFTQGITGTATAGLTTGPDGNLWFTEEAGGGRIGRITPDGVITEFTQGLTSGSTPFDITTGPDGNLWFTEANGTRVGRITTAGAITEFSAGITASSQPEGITAGPDGNLWFTENDGTHGNKIGRITTGGTVTEFSTGLTAGCRPFGITTGPDGALWFCENNADRIGRITTGGTVTEFSTGITPGCTPSRITTGPDGRLWFTEFNGTRIGRITTGGTVAEFSQGITAGSFPGGITTSPDGAIWFTELGSGKIARITTTGVITEPTSVSSTNEPNVLVTGPDGNLWFSETSANKLAQLKFLSGAGAPVSVVTGQTFSGFLDTEAAFDTTTETSDLQAEIDWGDGTASGGVITGNAQSGFRITGTHTYEQFGAYTAEVAVSHLHPAAGLPPSTDTTPVAVEVSNLLDASFESPALGFGNFAYAPAGSPWAFAGSAGLAANSSAATAGNPPIPRGGQALFLQNNGAAGQVFILPAGTYAVSLLAAQRGSFNTARQTFQVWVDNAPLSTFTPTSAGFTRMTSNAFTVGGGFHMVSLVGINPSGGDNVSLIDNVNLVALTGVADPSFEQPVLAPAAFLYTPAGSPWAFTGGAGLTVSGGGFAAANPPAPQGNQILFLQQTGTATQSIDFAAGSYQITFRAAQRGSFNAHDQTFQVLVDGANIGIFNNLTGSAFALQTTNTFTVTTGVHTVQLKGTDQNGGDCTVLIDQFGLNAVSATPVNQGFEAPTLAAGTFVTAPSGAFTGSAGIAANGSGFTSASPPAPQGVQVAFLQATGTTRQAIVLSAGTYAVDFYAAQRGSFNASTQTIRVLIDGVEIGRFTPGGSAYTFQTTNTFTVATGGQAHNIQFEGLNPNGGDNTALIDDVFVQLVG
jgi:streptogramin lyase